MSQLFLSLTEPGEIMNSEHSGAARVVADKLFAAEDAIDAALVAVGELNDAMLHARARLALPATVGQGALERTTEALLTLVQARRQIIEAHNQLDTVRSDIGGVELRAGDGAPKPSLPAV
jgi:hypothetical protein